MRRSLRKAMRRARPAPLPCCTNGESAYARRRWARIRTEARWTVSEPRVVLFVRETRERHGGLDTRYVFEILVERVERTTLDAVPACVARVVRDDARFWGTKAIVLDPEDARRLGLDLIGWREAAPNLYQTAYTVAEWHAGHGMLTPTEWRDQAQRALTLGAS